MLWPVRALRHAAYASGGYYGPWIAAWNALVTLAIVAALLWYAHEHPQLLHRLLAEFTQWWQANFGRHELLST